MSQIDRACPISFGVAKIRLLVQEKLIMISIGRLKFVHKTNC
jgi:hypothetical protein